MPSTVTVSPRLWQRRTHESAKAAAHDTVAAKAIALQAVEDYALDPQAHAVLADMMLSAVSENASCVMEATIFVLQSLMEH